MTDHSHISRRTLLGGIGVAGAALPAAGVVLASSGSAVASPNVVPHVAAGQQSTTAPPYTVFRDVVVGAAGFRADASTLAFTSPGATFVAGGTGRIVASLAPDPGDALLDLSVTLDPAGQTGSVTLSRHKPGTDQTLGTASYGPAAGVTTVTAQVDPIEYAEPDTWSYQITVDVKNGVVVHQATVNFFSPASQVVLIPPTRIFDTRAAHSYIPLPTSPHIGKVSAGQQIGFSVDPVVSRYINGVILNVTVTETEGGGYVVAWIPTADDPSTGPPPVSNINWSAPDQTLANLVFARLFEEADVLINVGGVGKTHIVVDVIGYLA
jgi:hypothetical protein